MKISQKIAVHFFVSLMVLIAFGLTFLGNGCSGFKKGQSDFVDLKSGGTSEEYVSGEKTLAILNFSNILKTFDAMIASTTPNNFSCSSNISQITVTYNDHKEALSIDGEVSSFNAPMQIAIANIAAKYCECAVNSASQSNLFSGFNLNGSPNQFNAQNVDALGAKMAQVFWQGTWDASYSAELMSLVDSILQNKETQNDSTVSRNVLLGVCTALMSSYFAIQM